EACRNAVARVWGSCRWIENSDRTLRKRLRKIAGPLERRGHGSEAVVPAFGASAEIVDEEKDLVVVNEMRNIERPARGKTEAVISVRRFGDSLSPNRLTLITASVLPR